MATHKTAYYSGGTPLAVGAIVGGGSQDEVESLRSFGLATGLAFQIQDDILNLIGKKEAVKKDFRSDIIEGKRTLIAVHAIHHSQRAAELIAILGAHTEQPALLDDAVGIMQQAGSVDFAREYATQLVTRAKLELSESIVPSKARDLLLSMADFFVTRMN
jgi:geranylgeranyl diphosphate synthase type I